MRSTVKRLNENGLTGFYDRNGRSWTPEAYARMCVRNACMNASKQAVFDRNEQYGNDLVWVRTNATAREKCYPWQGKVISMNGRSGTVKDGQGRDVRVYSVEETTYGEPDGLWGINCHHVPPNVFIPGASTVRGAEMMPSPEENRRRYALTQQQRKLEREVRYAKREAAMHEAAGTYKPEDGLKVQEAQKRLRTLIGENPDVLVRDPGREWVSGYSRYTGLNRRVLVDGEYIKPMPKKELQRITKAFRKKGGKIIMDDEAQRMLKEFGVQGVTVDEKTILLVKNPTRATVFEELIHSAQYRDGIVGDNDLKHAKAEVAAKEKLLRNRKAYKLTDAEVRETQKLLEKDRRNVIKYAWMEG